MATADTWAKIHSYGHLGTTTFLNANPGIGTDTLEQGQRDYPQQTVFGRALSRQRAGGSAPSGTPTVQRGGTTGPLQTPPPQPLSQGQIIANRAQGTPEPDRLAPPERTSFSRNLTRQLKALDDHAAVIPTPGDLGPWVLALLVILFAIVPFNGYTRLQLIWYALSGAASVPNAFVQMFRPGGASGSGTSGGNVAQPPPSSGSGGTLPPPPKQEAPGGFTPRVVGGGL